KFERVVVGHAEGAVRELGPAVLAGIAAGALRPGHARQSGEGRCREREHRYARQPIQRPKCLHGLVPKVLFRPVFLRAVRARPEAPGFESLTAPPPPCGRAAFVRICAGLQGVRMLAHIAAQMEGVLDAPTPAEAGARFFAVMEPLGASY